MKTYTIGRFKLCHSSRHEMTFISVRNGGLYDLRAWIPPVKNTYLRLRLAFPTFYLVGLHDCDTGGRCFAVTKGWAWSSFYDLDRVLEGFHSSSDGPASIGRVSLWRFLRHSGWERV